VTAGLAVATLAAALASAPATGAAAYEEIAVKDGGALSGSVRFSGAVPKLEPLVVGKHREVCGERKPSEVLALGPERGVMGSVVLLEGVTRGKRVDGEVVVDNHGCLFGPHVSAVMAGGRARVRNSDEMLHNPQGWTGKSPVFNVALPGKEQVIDVTRRLTGPAVVRLLCGVHPHMSGWLVVHDSPYVAVTDERGAYRIDGIPPGSYRVTMWHEGFRPKGVDKDGRPLYDDPRTVTRDVTIAPRGTVTVDFELK
jgi:hypothetical protein